MSQNSSLKPSARSWTPPGWVLSYPLIVEVQGVLGVGGVPVRHEQKKADWDAKKTAIIICDMWDDHWCKSAARRVSELARPLSEAVKAARAGIYSLETSANALRMPQAQAALFAATASAKSARR